MNGNHESPMVGDVADTDPDAGLKEQLYADVLRGPSLPPMDELPGVVKDFAPVSLWITRAAMKRAGPTGSWSIATLMSRLLLGRKMTEEEETHVALCINWLTTSADPTAEDGYRLAVAYAMRQAGATWEDVATVDSQLDRRRTDKAAMRRNADRVRKQVERYAVSQKLEPPGRYHRPPVMKEGHGGDKEGQTRNNEGQEGQNSAS